MFERHYATTETVKRGSARDSISQVEARDAIPLTPAAKAYHFPHNTTRARTLHLKDDYFEFVGRITKYKYLPICQLQIPATKTTATSSHCYSRWLLLFRTIFQLTLIFGSWGWKQQGERGHRNHLKKWTWSEREWARESRQHTTVERGSYKPRYAQKGAHDNQITRCILARTF